MGKRIPVEFVIKRRKLVAELIGKGFTQGEVVDYLQRETVVIDGVVTQNRFYVINPNTGEAFNKSTICRDYAKLKERWDSEISQLSRDFLDKRLDSIVDTFGKHPSQVVKDISVTYVTDGGVVYFVERVSDGCIKIGTSAYPLARMTALESEYGAIIPMGWEIGGIKKERELHQRFSSIRESGEWFFPAPILLDYIRDNAFVFNPSHVFHRYALLETMYVDMENRLDWMQAEIDSIKKSLE